MQGGSVRRSLAEAFRRRAALSGAHVAIVDRERSFRYAELDAASERLARELVWRGAGRGQRVGILLPRSAELAVAVVAIVKAGAAYVPLDPDYPVERLRFLVA